MLEDMTAPAPVDPGGVTAPILRIGTKADKTPAMAVAHDYDLRISSVTGQGIETLLDAIRRRADAATQAASDILPSRLRHMKLLEETQSFLERAQGGRAQELRAEELRLAADRLGRIVGTVDVEDLLDVIFSQFCIGK